MSPYRTGIITDNSISEFISAIHFHLQTKHRNKIISVNKVSSYRTALITETNSFLCLFLQLKICLPGQVPRLGGAN